MQVVVSAKGVNQRRNHKHPYCPSNEDVRSVLEPDGDATEGEDANDNVDFVLSFWVHKMTFFSDSGPLRFEGLKFVG